MTRSEKLNAIFIQIRTKRGRLTPAVVVAEAARPSHPLHGEFDWNNKSAGHKYRLEQAAELIRFVRVKVVTADGNYRVRQFHAVRAAGVIEAPDGYLPNEEVAASPVYRQAMLRQMERDWQAMVARYEHLREFWSMVNRTKRRKKRRAG